MLSDEENQAIKECDNIFMCLDDAMSEDSANDYRKSYKILKNLIKKQSKEIEELKEEQCCMTTCLRKDKEKLFLEDKIKAKIEELKQKKYILSSRESEIEILQSLLEDNKEDNTEEIEDNKEDNTEEIEKINLHYVTCESDFKNMNIVKKLNKFFEENNLIVNELVRAVNKIGRNKTMLDEEIISLNRMKLFARSSDLSVVTAKDMNIVVNLVEKQQKEIEELNKSDASKEQSSINYYNLYKELVDKIRNKIKDLTEYYEKEVKPEMYHWGDFTAEEYYAGVITELKMILDY